MDWENEHGVVTPRSLFEWAEANGYADTEIGIYATTAGGNDAGTGVVQDIVVHKFGQDVITLENYDG